MLYSFNRFLRCNFEPFFYLVDYQRKRCLLRNCQNDVKSFFEQYFAILADFKYKITKRKYFLTQCISIFILIFFIVNLKKELL